MLEPMLATLADAPLNDADFVYEPKYDGIRAIAEVPARGRHVRLWSRLGNEKTRQFPEVVEALETWAANRRAAVVLDGEIVALDADGRPAGFQNLQGRIHVPGMRPGKHVPPANAAFIVFDVLKLGERDLRPRPLSERREQLEGLLAGGTNQTLRLSEQMKGDGRTMQARAIAEGWEGLIAKRAASVYRSGKRSPDWRKLKLVHEQEFVIGGWTEPRQSRSYFGALLLGVYGHAPRRGKAELIYTGHVGTGFDHRELARLMALLKPLEIDRAPFTIEPPTNERAHWVTPTLVAQVRFSEWTADNILRHPVYLGLRDDKKARDVHRERTEPAQRPASFRRTRSSPTPEPRRTRHGLDPKVLSSVMDQITALEKRREDGVLELPDGGTLEVTNLAKVFWPKQGLTKGALLRYYTQIAPFILPVIADRPLVMKRFPNGVAAKPFYQHHVTNVPQGVRMARIDGETGGRQIIGGDLLTLLYTAQLAAISQDPWFSRMPSLDAPDFLVLDLDPAPGVPFARVRSVALWLRDEMAALRVPSFVKTSGAHGMHVCIPLPANTQYDTAQLFARVVAAIVAEQHPREATIERSVKSRGSRIYIDYLQNARGKTLACAYSARASDFAGVSTPLTWQEVEAGARQEAFTIETVPYRLHTVGDLWKELRDARGADLINAVEALSRRHA